MGRKQLTISIPEVMHGQIEARVRGSRYSTVSEYFRHLVWHDIRRQEQLEAERQFEEYAIRRPLASAARRK